MGLVHLATLPEGRERCEVDLPLGAGTWRVESRRTHAISERHLGSTRTTNGELLKALILGRRVSSPPSKVPTQRSDYTVVIGNGSWRMLFEAGID